MNFKKHYRFCCRMERREIPPDEISDEAWYYVMKKDGSCFGIPGSVMKKRRKEAAERAEKIRNARYTIEQGFLPSYFFGLAQYNCRIGIMAGAYAENTAEMIGDCYRELMGSCPYPEEAFSGSLENYEKDGLLCSVARIGMPEPELPTQARSILIFFCEERKSVRYYTVEKTAKGGWALCRTDALGLHAYCGPTEETDGELIERLKRELEL